MTQKDYSARLQRDGFQLATESGILTDIVGVHRLFHGKQLE